MVEFLADYGLFLLKVLTVVIAIIVVAVAMVAVASKGRKSPGAAGSVSIIRLNEQFDDMRDTLSMALLDDSAAKFAEKERKAEEKAKRKKEKKQAKAAAKKRGKGETRITEALRKRVFVVDFDGDIRASAVENLRHELSAILTTATSQDEVVVRLESGGGMVSSYGLGASQLARVLDKNIPLTVTVDTVAASGGYMMACVSNKILAAPFAMVGSIGVVAQMPNFHRLLKKNDIDIELLTAGKYKRTLTVLGENTDEAREKFIEDIERIHGSFKDHVQTYRRKLDIEKVATGEVWLGQEAKELDLVDVVTTSDEYLMKAADAADVMIVRYKQKKGLGERLSISFQAAVDGITMRWFDRLSRSRFYDV